VVKVRQQPRSDGSRPVPFKLQLKGTVPLEHLRHFVALDLRRQGQDLQLEHLEVLAPVTTRGNRGGKGRREGAPEAWACTLHRVAAGPSAARPSRRHG
jgi:hypothetical protein